MKTLHVIAFILLIIGGLNLGIVGVSHYDVLSHIFGTGAVLSVIYILIGLSALWELFRHPSHCKVCKNQQSSGSATM